MARLRCPECRTRRTDPHAMVLHVLRCKRPLCHCLGLTYPHRPMSGLCHLNPEAQVSRALDAAGPGDNPVDLFLDVALSMPGKPMKAWPFDKYGVMKMRERDIERHLVQRVNQLGGEVRKVQFIGRRGAPDRLVMLPPVTIDGTPGLPPVSIWVELKATGIRPEPHQLREHDRMRAMGQRVEVIDSLDGVTELLS
jgi:hypothetical protein